GMTPAEIAMGVARCQPVEHRLELLSGGGGVSIIDDAFNANPVGAKAALRVLKNFPGRRIIITPGMVELGGEEAQFNREFGEQMAQSVDVAILVGKKHTQPIVDGLLSKDFPQEKIHVVSSLEESTKVLHAMMQAGDVVLYENDLPDNYSE
ncbi:MAG: UDP-N-acetylmuramoyl-tripeptide--D-alanyl-D-alanine ligase, partial [Clostridia bacterium]|nr:UDP-N-acetylmuramoyl-tripeptide--D-alanyl-D-alanine ligase [Clostridia bacterium]